MSSFRMALPTVFFHEGRYTNHPADPGGATDWGISVEFLRKTGDLNHDGFQDGDINHDGRIDIQDIRKLSRENAENLYRMYFWENQGYEKISDQIVATKLFDLAVNMGNRMANRLSQRAIRSAIRITLEEDGILGNASIRAINLANPVKLLPALKSEAAGFYRSIRLKNGHHNQFIRGWLNRAYSDPVFEPSSMMENLTAR